MRNLMRSRFIVAALAIGGVAIHAPQQDVVRIGNEARIFHRAAEQRHRHLIELFVRIRDVEVVLERSQDAARDLYRIGRFCRATFRHDHADGRFFAACLAAVDNFKGSHSEGDEVAWQRFRLSKADQLHPIFCGLFFYGRRIRERFMVFLHGQRQLPRHFESGLVEAGKSFARPDWFELCVYVVVAVVFAAKKSATIFGVDFTVISQHQLRRAFFKSALKANEIACF